MKTYDYKDEQKDVKGKVGKVLTKKNGENFPEDNFWYFSAEQPILVAFLELYDWDMSNLGQDTAKLFNQSDLLSLVALWVLNTFLSLYLL